MKKYLKGILTAVFAFIVFIPFANAANLTQADFNAATAAGGTEVNGIKTVTTDGEGETFLLAPNSYTLTENIDGRILITSGEATINLNGKTFNGDIIAKGATVTIEGAGTVENGASSKSDGVLTIKNGTYHGPLTVENSKLVVENATVNTGDSADAIYAFDGADIVVEGGTFTSDYSGIISEKLSGTNIKSIVIKGGIFTGGLAGLSATKGDYDSIKISGGTFKATGGFNFPDRDKKSAIVIYTTDATVYTTIFDGLLADGASYSATFTPANLESGDYEVAYMDKDEISVTSSESDEEGTTTTEETASTTTEPAKIEVLDGKDQKYDATKGDRLRFRFDIELAKFKASGKVFMDGKEVDSKHYELSEGSTIVTFTKTFTDELKAGNHTVKITTSEGEAEAAFNVTKAVKNPQTGDNIKDYILLVILSIMTILSVVVYNVKRDLSF